MEILAENIKWAEYVLTLAFTGVVALIFLIGCISLFFDFVRDAAKDTGNLFGFVFILSVSAFASFATVTIFNQGPDVHYEALVTDFNEVYAQGYEIVDQRGQIYVLRKVVE